MRRGGLLALLQLHVCWVTGTHLLVPNILGRLWLLIDGMVSSTNRTVTLVVHRLVMRCRLLLRFGQDRVVHSLLGLHLAVLVLVLLHHHSVVRLYVSASDLLLATLSNLGLILVSILQELEAVTDLGLVKAVRVVRWLRGSRNSLLAGSCR